MFNYATLLLCGLGFWDLWRVHGQYQVNQHNQTTLDNQQTRINQIAVHQQQWFAYNSLRRTETEERINKLESRLQAIQTQMEAQLHEIRNLTDYQREKEEPPPKVNLKRFPTKAGDRHFYVEKQVKVNWHAAYDKCRQMGGHLATFRDEREFSTIFGSAPRQNYWIDIYNLARDNGPFISSLTGRKPPYIKWNLKNNWARTHYHCVNVFLSEMINAECYIHKYAFVCQAEQWE